MRPWRSGSTVGTRRCRCATWRHGPMWPWARSTATSPARTTCWPRPSSTGWSSWTPAWPSYRPRATPPRPGSSTSWTERCGPWAASRSWWAQSSPPWPRPIRRPSNASNRCRSSWRGSSPGPLANRIHRTSSDRARILGHVWYSALVGLGQRLEQHGAGPRRAGGGGRAAVAERHLRRRLTTLTPPPPSVPPAGSRSVSDGWTQELRSVGYRLTCPQPSKSTGCPSTSARCGLSTT